MSKDVSGQWHATQSNGPVVTFDLREDANGGLTGSARFSDDSGVGDGEVSDSAFFFRVRWNGGPVGDYHGSFGLDGRLTGITFDERNAASQAFWHSNKTF
jgi:hypothetical protein